MTYRPLPPLPRSASHPGGRLRVRPSGTHVGILCLLATLLLALTPHAARAAADAAAAPVVQQLAEFERLATRQPARARRLLDALAPLRATLTDAMQLQLALAEAELANNEWRLQEAAALATKALALAQQLGDRSAQARMLNLQAEVHGQFGQLPEAFAHSDRALALADAEGDANVKLAVWLSREVLHIRANQFEQAIAWQERAQAVALELGTNDARARVASMRAFLARAIADYEAAAPALREAQEAFLADDNLIQAVDHQRDHGIILLRLGRAEDAEKQLASAVRRYVELTDDGGRSIALSWLAVAQFKRGYHRQALDTNREALALMSSDDLRGPRIVALIDRAEFQLGLGDIAGSLQSLRSARALDREVPDPTRARHLLRVEALVLAGAGRHREAYAALRSHNEMQQRLDAQRLVNQLAAQRGRLEAQRLQRELDLLQREKAASEQALSESQRATQLQWTLLLVLGALLGYGVLRLWHRGRQQATLAATDALTGKPNRRRLFELGEEMLARCRAGHRPFAVVMLDVDHFKDINDRHGHAAGDRVLKRIADTLAEQLRPDDRLGRYGGEEFAVLLPATSATDAVAVAERLRAAIAALPPGQLALDRSISISGGVAGLRADDAGFAALVERADAALYRAKENGRNRVAVSAAAPVVQGAAGAQ